MSLLKHYADIPTPVPGAVWTTLNERQRVDQIKNKLQASPVQFLPLVEIIAAKADGQVILQMKESLPASERGPFLLDIEDYIKRTVDEGLAVWLEPLGDRSSLRNLRGIEVKVS